MSYLCAKYHGAFHKVGKLTPESIEIMGRNDLAVMTIKHQAVVGQLYTKEDQKLILLDVNNTDLKQWLNVYFEPL